MKYLNSFNLKAKKEKHNFISSDGGCGGGQNQNRMRNIMLSNALIQFKLNFIELTFFVLGHSQNENYAAH